MARKMNDGNTVYVTKNGNKRYPSIAKAKKTYDDKTYDKILVRLPKGKADEIKEKTGKAPATFVKECALAELEKISEVGKMLIIVSLIDFNKSVKDFMNEIKDEIAVTNPHVDYSKHTIKIPLIKTEILFKPALQKCIIGTRPDYYWTNSYDVDKYYRYCNDVKCLQNFTELTNLVFMECAKKEDSWSKGKEYMI